MSNRENLGDVEESDDLIIVGVKNRKKLKTIILQNKGKGIYIGASSNPGNRRDNHKYIGRMYVWSKSTNMKESEQYLINFCKNNQIPIKNKIDSGIEEAPGSVYVIIEG